MRILIVDDSVFAQQYTKQFIAKKYDKAEFVFANSGKKGYELYMSKKPDLVITDLLMPDMSGKDMISMIQEVNRDCRIIVISSDIQKAIKEEMIELGVLAFINKPLNDLNAKVLLDIIGGLK